MVPRLLLSSILLVCFVSFATASEKTTLSLQDCVTLALEKNFIVRSKRIDYDIQQEQVRSNRGQFDPQLNLSYSKQKEESLGYPNASIESIGKDTSSQFSLSGSTTIGTRYSLGIQSLTERTDGGATESLISSPTAYIEIMQPLLKGGLRNNSRTTLEVSKRNLEIENWRFKSIVIDTILEVVAAYADLYFASSQLEIAINNKNLADQLLKDNKKRVSLGSQSETDIILAESRSLQRQEAVFQAEVYLHTQQNVVKQLISDEMLSLLGLNLEIEKLPSFAEEKPMVKDDFPMALNENPLFQMATIGVDIQELLLLQRQFDLLASLNLKLRYDTNGVGASSSDGWQSLKDADGEGWYGGVEFSLPIPNRTERAKSRIGSFAKRQQELELERIQQAVLLQLDNAAFRLRKAWERMNSSEQSRELAEQSLRAEEKKLRAGRSQSFFVLDQQQRVANVQLQEIQSKVDYFKSLSAYHKERGTLLEVYAVEIPLIDRAQSAADVNKTR